MNVAQNDGFVNSKPIEIILQLLEGVRPSGDSGHQWEACCPAHGDQKQSLAVHERADGVVLLHCHSGCSFAQVMAALGLPKSAAYPPRGDRPERSSRTQSRNRQTTPPPSTPPPTKPPPDIPKIVSSCDHGIGTLEHLAKSLGVSIRSLVRLGVSRYRADRQTDVGTKDSLGKSSCWVIPERSPDGKIVGLQRRYDDGAKIQVGGTKRGLNFDPSGFSGSGPILVVEGASDTAALLTLGFDAVGRPSAAAGAEMIADLLGQYLWQSGRDVIVFGENDLKPNGRSPGVEGAAKVAAKLSALIGLPVQYALPPDGAKDVRSWLQAQNIDPNDPSAVEVARLRVPLQPIYNTRPEGVGVQTDTSNQIKDTPNTEVPLSAEVGHACVNRKPVQQNESGGTFFTMPAAPPATRCPKRFRIALRAKTGGRSMALCIGCRAWTCPVCAARNAWRRYWHYSEILRECNRSGFSCMWSHRDELRNLTKSIYRWQKRAKLPAEYLAVKTSRDRLFVLTTADMPESKGWKRFATPEAISQLGHALACIGTIPDVAGTLARPCSQSDVWKITEEKSGEWDRIGKITTMGLQAVEVLLLSHGLMPIVGKGKPSGKRPQIEWRVSWLYPGSWTIEKILAVEHDLTESNRGGTSSDFDRAWSEMQD